MRCASWRPTDKLLAAVVVLPALAAQVLLPLEQRQQQAVRRPRAPVGVGVGAHLALHRDLRAEGQSRGAAAPRGIQ